MSVSSNSGNFSRLRTKKPRVVTISARKERNLSIKKVSLILQKDESMRTKEERELLFNYSEVVKEAAGRIEKRRQLKERLKEVEDSEPVLDAKCKQLAEAISKSKYLVVYTGAGISTAARIPDYRGASGIWTLLQQGKDIGTHDLTQADPTYTHMALFQLYIQGKVKHVVSQNCDGLHLRSGLPKQVLSEVHGNMYIEVCKTCKPIIEYLRLFDVTENTGRYTHRTMRKCYKCNSSLVDSIVHFGERGNLPWPLNWRGACKAAEKADMILCIGSSLKVLKRYPWLWCMDKPLKRRPDVYIVNLQWTPKDCQAAIKINGKCDTVMEKLMKYLAINVPKYSRKCDPLFEHATHLCKEELHTKNRPFLTFFKQENFEVKSEHVCINSNIEIKKESDFDWETVQNTRQSNQESSVTSCKKEIVMDTGQGKDVNCIKQELILITIRSGAHFKDCCDLFKVNQMHDCECPNFIDEKNDIPVIIQDDFLILKNTNTTTIKVENLVCPANAEQAELAEEIHFGNPAAKDGEFNSCNMKNLFADDNGAIGENQKKSNSKTTHDIEKPENNSKKFKFKCENDALSNSLLGLSNVSSSVLEPQCNEETKLKCNQIEDNSNPKGAGAPKCLFCWKQYLSNSCMFYMKREPIFKGDVPVCDCCSSDEEDEGENSCNEKVSDLQARTNPGWYGKGLRKNIRKKR